MTSRSGAGTAFVAGLLAAGLLVAGAAPVAAQSSWLTGYVLTNAIFSGSTSLTDSNTSSANRIRLSTDPLLGPFAFDVAYEHAATFQKNTLPLGLGLAGLEAIQGGGEWLDLQGTITRHDQRHALWRHRFDRLNVAWSPTESMELSVGRQAISWGTTQVFSPADPFPAFTPTDPFQVYRVGVDAARLRIYPSALSEIDVVFRPSRSDVGEEVTALARGLTTWRGWGLSAWGGTLYGDPTGAVGASGGIGPWALYVEAVVRDYHGTVVGRGAIGTFRLFQVGGRDLAVSVDYQRDGRGASAPEELLTVLQSREFRRGEYQVIGRDEAAVSASYQIHPLWSLTAFTLWNLNDGSAIAIPGFSYSLSDEAALQGGVFVGFGDTSLMPVRNMPGQIVPSSVYGLVGTTGYLSLTWYF